MREHVTRRQPLPIPLFAFLLIILSAVPLVAEAMEIFPFYTRNENPLIQIFGLPSSDRARITGKGRWSTQFVVDAANHFGVSASGREKVVLDGESYRALLGVRYGIAEKLEIGADVPYIFYTGGFMDGMVSGFHDVFGLGQNGRDTVRKNRLLIEYWRDGVLQLRKDGADSGLGDISLFAGYNLFGAADPANGEAALRATLKLPTGSSRKLHGSGNFDGSLSLLGSREFSVGRGNVGVFASAGTLFLGSGDILPRQQRDIVYFGTAGVGWSPWQAVAFKFQSNAHSSFYRGSELMEIDSPSVQLILGVAVQLPAEMKLDVGVMEEIFYPSAAPDVLFNLGLRKDF